VDVASGGSSLTASLSPNPMNPEGVFAFRTTRVGPVRVRLYDMTGRLVRTLVDLSSVPAGYCDARFDGKADNGHRLPSAVYFYRLETGDGVTTGRLVIAR